MQSLKNSPFQAVPDEINLQILQFLGVKEVGIMARTCKQFEILSQDEQVWKSRCLNTFGELTKVFRKEDKTWKHTCQVIAQHKKNVAANAKKMNLNIQVPKVTSMSYRPMRTIPPYLSFRDLILGPPFQPHENN